MGGKQHIVTEFLAQTNDLSNYNRQNREKEVLMIAATNHPQMIDPAVWYVRIYFITGYISTHDLV